MCSFPWQYIKTSATFGDEGLAFFKEIGHAPIEIQNSGSPIFFSNCVSGSVYVFRNSTVYLF